jgi:hypothetical protein
MHDHRVSEPREEDFDGFVDKPCTGDALKRGIIKYFTTKIRNRTLPHYVYKKVNENNILSGNPTIVPSINKDLELVRVLDITGLGEVFQWAKRKKNWGKTLKRFPRYHNEQDVIVWLDGYLQKVPRQQALSFVAILIDILNQYRNEHAYQPTWATAWVGFQHFLKDGPDRWLQVVGVARTPPRWVILLKYRLREAGTIVRPTLLDAGWLAYHFPSPPQAPLANGGHPMDIRISPRSTALLPEYIHKQIDHSIDHFVDIGRTSKSSSDGLADQRRTHHNLLIENYGPDILSWMPSPI